MNPQTSASARDPHDAVSLESLLGQLSRLGRHDVDSGEASGNETDANRTDNNRTDNNKADNSEADASEREGKGAGDTGKVSVGDIIHVVGDRSFAPLLMLVGMLLVSPLSGIPTFPSLVASIVLLVTLQMVFGRKHFWLPSRLQAVQMPRDKLHTALSWLQRPARFIDRLTRRRLTLLVRGPGAYLIAVVCLSIACLLPMTEVIPFSSSVVGVVLTLFGVALVSRDGLFALLGYGATASVVWLLMSALE